MDAGMTFNWLDTRRTASVHGSYTQRVNVDRLTRENARLLEENERLKRLHAELVSSAELWIRLYEAALARAAAAEVAAANTSGDQGHDQSGDAQN
jgi:hypothetical protein